LLHFSIQPKSITMKHVKIAALAAVAAGTFLATSCCTSNPSPAPAAPTYVSPSK
jgi:hypothetical protein